MNKRTILNALCLILGVGCIALTFTADNTFSVVLYLIVGLSTLFVGISGIRLNKR